MPPLRFEITKAGRQLFPVRDGVLLGGLIDFLRERGHEALLQSFFEDYWQERLQEVKKRLRATNASNMDCRLDVLERMLREEGFVPDIRREKGRLVVRECNCPFPEAVKKTRLPCRLEAAFYEALFDQRIERMSYIPDGHPSCIYAFPGREGPPAAGERDEA